MAPFAESHVEEAALAWLAELGYATANGLDIGPDGGAPERASYGDVLLVKRVRAAVAKLNPTLTAETRAECCNQAPSNANAVARSGEPAAASLHDRGCSGRGPAR